MRRGLICILGLASALLAASSGVAAGAAWKPSGSFEGDLGRAVMNSRGDVAALVGAHWPARGSTLHLRPAGGSFTALALPGRPSTAHLSDSGELLLTLISGNDRDPTTSVLHRSSTGEQTVTPLPGLRFVRVAQREDGLGLLFARRGDDGEPVIAWKAPGAAEFGDPIAVADVEPAIPNPHFAPPPIQPGPDPTLGFTEGVAVMLMRRGQAMEARAASPYGSFGSPVRLGPASEHSRSAELHGRGGHMVAIWDSGGAGLSQNTLYAATKRPGQGFGPALSVASGIGLTYPRVAMSAGGHLVIPWTAVRSVMRPGETLFQEQAVEQRPGTTGFRPVVVPAELTGPGAQAQFDSTGAAVLSGSASGFEAGRSGEPVRRKLGFWTWSRAADGTLGGPDLVSGSAAGGIFLLNERGQGIAFGRSLDLKRTTVFDYDEAASLGRNRPVLSALKASRPRRATSAAARRAPAAFLRLRLTKTARVRVVFEQLGRAGVVRVRCSSKARRRAKTCKRRRVIAGWRKAQVGANSLPPSKAAKRFLARPGLYRISVRPRDSRGRYGRARAVRVRVKR